MTGRDLIGAPGTHSSRPGSADPFILDQSARASSQILLATGAAGYEAQSHPVQDMWRHHSCTMERHRLGSARHRTRLRHMGCCYVPVRQARQSGWDPAPSALGIGHSSPLCLETPVGHCTWRTDSPGIPRPGFLVRFQTRSPLALQRCASGSRSKTSRIQLTE